MRSVAEANDFGCLPFCVNIEKISLKLLDKKMVTCYNKYICKAVLTALVNDQVIYEGVIPLLCGKFNITA